MTNLITLFIGVWRIKLYFGFSWAELDVLLNCKIICEVDFSQIWLNWWRSKKGELICYTMIQGLTRSLSSLHYFIWETEKCVVFHTGLIWLLWSSRVASMCFDIFASYCWCRLLPRSLRCGICTPYPVLRHNWNQNHLRSISSQLSFTESIFLSPACLLRELKARLFWHIFST